MAHGLVAFDSPLFALGGNIYPVDPPFDWTHDSDVLVDAIRQTHEAIRWHAIAAAQDDRSWFLCECADVVAHRDLLVLGHAALLEVVLRSEPDAPVTRSRQLPVTAMFLRTVQSVALLVTALGLQDLVA